MTDSQWELIEPLLPTPGWLAGRGGRRAKHCRREIVDAILYIVDNGIKWQALPTDFPPWSTVYNHFAAWEHQSATQDVLDALRDRARLTEGRRAAPSAGIIDSASVKATETAAASARTNASPNTTKPSPAGPDPHHQQTPHPRLRTASESP